MHRVGCRTKRKSFEFYVEPPIVDQEVCWDSVVPAEAITSKESKIATFLCLEVLRIKGKLRQVKALMGT